MAGSVGLVYFEQGDDMTAPEFRERLNVLAQQGADATAWNFGYGLIGAYTPGTGFTLAVDDQLVPHVETAFLAEITEVDGKAASWKEMERTGTDSFGEKSGGRTGYIDDAGDSHDGESAAYEINGREGVAVGTRVMMWEVASKDGTTRYEYDLGTGLVETEEDAEEVGIAGAGEVGERADIWDRESGLTAKVWFMTRVHSDKGGALYGYQRMLELDTNGHVFKIGEEERYVIDSTTNCEGE